MTCCCSGGKRSVLAAALAAAGLLSFAGLKVAESRQGSVLESAQAAAQEPGVAEQDAAVRKAIATTALDYPMSWYEGDAERMARRLHPNLRKCIATPPVSDGGEWTLGEMTAQELINIVATGRGRETPVEDRRSDVTVLDVYGDIASVRIDMDGWTDFVHMAKIDGEWLIINVLWDLTPESKARRAG